MDSLGCGLGAFTSEPARIARDLAASVHGEADATILGTRDRGAPDLVAFANGTMVRYLDFNDAYLSSHPSDNFAPVLAAAEAFGATGRALITGCVLAYEIQGALADSFRLRDGPWDQAVLSAGSMPLGAGKVMGLSEAQLAEALRIAVVGGMALAQARRATSPTGRRRPCRTRVVTAFSPRCWRGAVPPGPRRFLKASKAISPASQAGMLSSRPWRGRRQRPAVPHPGVARQALSRRHLFADRDRRRAGGTDAARHLEWARRQPRSHPHV